jgi:FG-GAP-like repeat
MTFICSFAQKNVLRSFSLFALVAVILMAFFLSTPMLAATATTLSVSPASPAVGSVITFTATVGSTHGLVNFCNASAVICDDGALLGSVWVTTGGTATLKRSLPAGTTNVVAVYQGAKSSVIPVTVSGVEPDTAVKEFSTGQTAASGAVLISGDFNNDGHADILFYPKGGTPALYLGNGDGTFTTGPVPTFLNNTAWSGYENNSQNWVMGDFNRDGNLDFVGGNPPQVFLGNGAGGFTAGQKLSVLDAALITNPTILLDDYNVDGYPDLAIFSGNSNDSDACKVQIFFGKGDGTFTKGPATPVGFDQLEGDGVHCIDWTATPHYDSTQAALGGYPGLDGSGGFTVTQNVEGQSEVYHVFVNTSGIPTSYSNSNFANPAGTTWGDFTGTGEAVIDSSTSTLPLPSGCGSPFDAVGDFNSDGYTDLACLNNYAFYGFDLQAASGRGNNTLGAAWTFTADYPEGPYGLASGDFYSTGSPAVALLSGDPTAYVTIVAPLKITPAKVAPTIIWATPADITSGTALSATQLNATANVPGTFLYTPAAGTVLNVGSQTLLAVFTPTDSTDYSPARATITINVNPAVVSSYTLTSNTQSVVGSGAVTLSLTSTNYAGTVSFVATVSSLDGTASNVSASAPSVTLTNGGNGNTVLTISSNANATNHSPVAPWSSGGTIMLGAVLLGAPLAARRKQVIAVLLTAAAITLAGFSMACGKGGTSTPVAPATRTYTVTVTPTGTGAVTNPAPVTITVTN